MIKEGELRLSFLMWKNIIVFGGLTIILVSDIIFLKLNMVRKSYIWIREK